MCRSLLCFRRTELLSVSPERISPLNFHIAQFKQITVAVFCKQVLLILQLHFTPKDKERGFYFEINLSLFCPYFNRVSEHFFFHCYCAVTDSHTHTRTSERAHPHNMDELWSRESFLPCHVFLVSQDGADSRSCCFSCWCQPWDLKWFRSLWEWQLHSDQLRQIPFQGCI